LRNLFLVLLAAPLLASAAAAAPRPATPPPALDTTIDGFTAEVRDGRLQVALARAALAAAIVVQDLKLSLPYRPSAALVLTPVTAITDLVIAEMDFSVARISMDLGPLEAAGVQLPGGFIASLLRAQLQAFDTREVTFSTRAGKVAFGAKSGIVHSRLEGQLGWGEGSQLVFRVDALRVNFGLPVPRSLLMKRLAWLDPLDFVDVRENLVIVDLTRLAKIAAESLPKGFRVELPHAALHHGRLVLRAE
jgi:hypothetical protein